MVTAGRVVWVDSASLVGLLQQATPCGRQHASHPSPPPPPPPSLVCSYPKDVAVSPTLHECRLSSMMSGTPRFRGQKVSGIGLGSTYKVGGGGPGQGWAGPLGTASSGGGGEGR